MTSLAGHRALVTGASRGIGRATALALAEAGADVAVTARSADDLETLAAEIGKTGRKAVAIAADLAMPESAKRIVAEAVAGLGGLDILVNNAGIEAPWKRAEKLTREHWDRLLEVNLKAPFFLAQEAFPHLRHREGAIVNVASIAGLEGTDHMLPYSATKAALIQVTKDLAMEWAAHKVRVNAVAPGWIETAMTKGVRGHDEIRKSIEETIPLRRFGRPEEIAGLIVFLCSPAASYVTGATIVADGGESV